MFAGKRVLVVSSVVAMCGFSVAGVAQQGRRSATADYAQADLFMNYNVNPLVYAQHRASDVDGGWGVSGIAIRGRMG